jgi:hypothetical protein
MGTKKEFSYIDWQTEDIKECDDIKIQLYGWKYGPLKLYKTNYINISKKALLEIVKILKEEEARNA